MPMLIEKPIRQSIDGWALLFRVFRICGSDPNVDYRRNFVFVVPRRELMTSASRILLLLAIGFVFSSSSFCQWENISGSGGGVPYAIIPVPNGSDGSDLFVGLNMGRVSRSTDNGATWTTVSLGSTNSNVLCLLSTENASGGTLLMAGTNGGGVLLSSDQGAHWHESNSGLTSNLVLTLASCGSRYFAGTSAGGIYVSTNAGESWAQSDSGLIDTTVYSIVCLGNKMFAATKMNGVFLSDDSGASWNAVNAGLPTGYMSSLVVSPNMGFGTTLYASGYGGIFRWSDSNGSWSLVGLADLYGYGSGVSSFAVSRNTIVAGTNKGSILVSTDGGTNWSTVSIGGGTGYVYSLSFPSIGSDTTTVYAGTAGGVFQSTDSGHHWRWRGVGGTIPGASCIAGSGKILYAGSNYFGLFISTNMGSVWHPANRGLIQYVLPTHTNGYYSVTSLAVSRTRSFVGAWDGLYVSIDSGETWSDFTTGLSLDHWPDGGAVGPIIISGQSLWVGTSYNGVIRSTDDGATWAEVNTGLPYMKVNNLARCGGKLYAMSGAVFVSTNEGNTWLTADVPFSNFGGMVEVGSTLYSGGDMGVFRSTNDGTTWSAANSGLTDSSIVTLATTSDSCCGTAIFARTSDGDIYCSLKGSTEWSSIRQGLPQAAVATLAIVDSNVIVAVDGNGVWKRSLREIIDSLSPRAGSIRVTVQNVPGYGPVDAGTSVSLMASSGQLLRSETCDSSGSVEFDDVRADTGYSIRVNTVPSSPSKIYGNEYWGERKGLGIAGAETTAVTFMRNAPYTSNILVFNNSTNEVVTRKYPIRNSD